MLIVWCGSAYSRAHPGPPSFPSFVSFFLREAVAGCSLLPASMMACGLDPHWHPYISRCGYCRVRYTVIAQLDQLGTSSSRITATGCLRMAYKDKK